MRIESGSTGNLSNNDKDLTAKPPIIFRAGWGALAPKWQEPLQVPVSKVLFTSTGTKECHSELECEATVGELQRLDMIIKGLPDIQYNFLVGGDNRVYEGRGWRVKADKDPKFKYLDGQTVDVAFIGDYNDRDPPKPMALASFLSLQSGHGQNCIEDEVEFIAIKNGEECQRFKINIVDSTFKISEEERTPKIALE